MLSACGLAWAQGPAPAPAPAATVAQALADDDNDGVPDRLGQPARIRGVVTIPPGELGGDNFVVTIQDATGGIVLFSNTLSMPLQAGDLVEASGVIGQYRGAQQLQKVQVVRLGHVGVPAAIRLPLTNAAMSAHMGQLVRVEGTIEKFRLGEFATVTLAGDDGKPVDLYFPRPVARDLPLGLFAAGSRISAVGVSSVYDRGASGAGDMEVIVIQPGKLRLVRAAPPPWVKWWKWTLAGFALALIPVSAVTHVVRRRRRERERELETFAALSLALEEPVASRELMAQHACEILTGHGLFDAVAIHSLDRGGDLRVLAACGIDPVEAAKIGEQQVRHRLQGAGAWSFFANADDALQPDAAGQHVLSVLPLSAPGRPIGALAAFSRQAVPATHIQRRMLLAAAKLVALGLANIDIHARAEEEQQRLRELAATDALTSLYNRRHLDDYLAEHIAAVGKSGGSMAFVAVDLDHFKAVNDTWGHETGDKVLVRASQEIRNATRASDIVVRYGGEEFLVVAPGMGLETAMQFAERLRARFDALRISDVVPGQAIHITISIGVAVLPLHGGSAGELLRACDLALYQSKNNGRNCVSVAAVPMS